VELDASSDAALFVGARYIAGSGLAGEPIAKLLPVGNRGGIRFGGRISNPHCVSLFSTFSEPEWPDTIADGTVRYWGDNRTPGNDLHGTPKKGNLLLRNIFQIGWAPEERWRLPLTALFSHHCGTRDVQLLALLVPGKEEDDLVALWRRNSRGWFQNYRATFFSLPVESVSRQLVASWPDLDRRERMRAFPSFGDWLTS
jgi:hypothetical protein